MKDKPRTLEQLGTALHAGDRDAVVSCFAAYATADVIVGELRHTLTGSEIVDAIGTLLSGFDHLKLTPTSLLVSKELVVEEAVLSGDHIGVFAGAEPTNRRVAVNVRLSATITPDSTLESLLVEADTLALFTQIGGTDDVIGVTGTLIAMARERFEGALHVTDETNPLPAPFSAAHRKARPSPSSARWVVAVTATAVLLAAGLVWRSASAMGSLAASHMGTTSLTTPSATPSTRVTAPKPRHLAPTKPAAGPVIATANPRTAPHVQAGKQVNLKSDVLFAFDSTTLTPAATTALTRLAQQVRKTKVTGTIQINGYTDNVGGAVYDTTLSRSRALAVAHVLQTALAGRPVTLVPQGFGQANPIASNASEAGRTLNRRVTIVLPV